MANNIIRGQFWRDSYMLNASPNTKYVYLYLLTNSNITGVYEITLQAVAFETGLKLEEVEQAFTILSKDGKIVYSKETCEICIVNWIKNNLTYSLNVNQLNGFKNHLKAIKNKNLLRYIKTDNEKLNNIIKEYIPTQEEEQEHIQLQLQEEIEQGQEETQEEYDDIQEEAEELLKEQIKQTLTPEQIQKQEKRREIEKELEEIKKLKLIPPVIIDEKKEDKTVIPQNIIDLNEQLKKQQKAVKDEFTKIGSIASQNLDNITNNKSIDNTNDNARRKTDNEYQQLYDAYPKKRNFDAGYFEYLTLSNSNELPRIEDLLNSLEDWKLSTQWEKPQFIPSINNWLKNKKFLVGFWKAKPQDINTVANG